MRILTVMSFGFGFLIGCGEPTLQASDQATFSLEGKIEAAESKRFVDSAVDFAISHGFRLSGRNEMPGKSGRNYFARLQTPDGTRLIAMSHDDEGVVAFYCSSKLEEPTANSRLRKLFISAFEVLRDNFEESDEGLKLGIHRDAWKYLAANELTADDVEKIVENERCKFE